MHRATAICVFALFAAAAVFAGPIGGMNYLRSVTIGSDAGTPTLNLNLDMKRGLDGRSVHYASNGHYILVTLPGTYVNPSKRTFKAEKGAIRSVFAAQRDKDSVNVKIELADDVRIDPYAIRDVVRDGRLTLAFPVTGTVSGRAAKLLDEPKKKKETAEPEAVAAPTETGGDLKAEVRAEFDQELDALFEEGTVREDAFVDDPGTTDEAAAADDPFAALFAGGDAKEVEKAAPGLGMSAVKMIAALCVVSGLIVMAGWVLKKVNLPGKGFGLDGDNIRILGTRSLGVKRNIVVVDVAGEVLVLATVGNDIRFLSKVENEFSRRRLLGDSAVPDGGTFLEKLGAVQQQDAKPTEPENEFGGAIDSIRKRMSQLRRIQ